MIRRVALGAAVALGALMGIGPAVALGHPLLLQASPAPGLVTPRSPAAISVALSEPAVPRGSSFTVLGPRGARIAVGAIHASDDRRTLSVTPRAALRSAVYVVRWSALGDDGHIVAGSFDFGVAGAKGAAPRGAERLSGTAGGGRGNENAVSDGLVRVLGRWLGIVAASLLLGGFVLVWLLRRRGADGDATALLRVAAPGAWMLVLLAASEGILAGASSGSSDSLDFGLLTASATGKADLARGLLAGAASPLLLVLGERRAAARDRVFALAGGGLLLTYAISGHVVSDPSALALLDQGAHVLAAGLWLGGLLALVLVTARGGVRLLDGARAFAPVAGAAMAGAVLTGVLAAVREVDRWYFLRWSDYGRVVLVKAALVAAVALGGALAWWRARDGRAPRAGLLRAEAAGVLVILGLAATLSGLAQGRGQPLPAQRGSLFAGPAFATALLPSGGAQVLLAPAREGANVLTVSVAPEGRSPRTVSVRLAHAGGGQAVRVALRATSPTTWSATVRLPVPGTWFGYVRADGREAAPVQLSVGFPHAAGASPVEVLAVADLSGPAAERCRAHVLGLELAIARINAGGGVDGGRKAAALVLDSAGTASGAARAARTGLASHPIALAGVCGSGAGAAIQDAARVDVPAIVGDPAVDPTDAPGVFRLAADPYAQGLAFGQLVRQRVLPVGDPGVRTVRVVAAHDLQGSRLVAGLRVGLRRGSAVPGTRIAPGPDPRLVVLAPGSLAGASPATLARIAGRAQTTALVIDGPSAGGGDAAATARLGRDRGERIRAAPVFASERVLSETYVRSGGSLGRIGALQGVSEVSTSTRDALLYQQAVPLLFRGDLASVDGLRGYVTGLALRFALAREGLNADGLRRALRVPGVFSDALLAPWGRAQPGRGSPSLVAIQPQFLSPTLVPSRIGGEDQESTYFPSGRWAVTSGQALGLSAVLRAPLVG